MQARPAHLAIMAARGQAVSHRVVCQCPYLALVRPPHLSLHPQQSSKLPWPAPAAVGACHNLRTVMHSTMFTKHYSD